MIGRADIEGSKSNVAMNAWLPQASYPCVEEAESEESQSFSRGAGKRRGKSSSPSPPPQLALLPKRRS
ncbi:hypothetical protein ACOMHN_057025 [Nucella lapillus]